MPFKQHEYQRLPFVPVCVLKRATCMVDGSPPFLIRGGHGYLALSRLSKRANSNHWPGCSWIPYSHTQAAKKGSLREGRHSDLGESLSQNSRPEFVGKYPAALQLLFNFSRSPELWSLEAG